MTPDWRHIAQLLAFALRDASLYRNADELLNRPATKRALEAYDEAVQASKEMVHG